MTETYMKNPQLDGESFFFSGNSIGVVLYHGFTATTAEVRLLGNYLHGQGYTVSAPLLPGHGTHPDDLNKRVWMEWYEAAEAAYIKMREHCSQVFVGGESMGSLLALLIASRYDKVDGLILASPALSVKHLNGAYVLRFVMKYLAKSPTDDGLAWKGYTVFPLNATVQLLKLQKLTKKELGNITQPALIFMGGKDDRIAPDSGRLVMQSIQSADKRLVDLENSPHCLLLASEKTTVFREVQTFLDNHVTRT
ncbi:MAG: alpha/beta fold hydrolase [Anaerolineaceae bacterium]